MGVSHRYYPRAYRWIVLARRVERFGHEYSPRIIGCDGVIRAGLSLCSNPKTRKDRSATVSFLLSGLVHGAPGGLFGMAGPPIVYHLYRQPFTLDLVRSTLLMVFACTWCPVPVQYLRCGWRRRAYCGYPLLLFHLGCTCHYVCSAFPPPLSMINSESWCLLCWWLVGINSCLCIVVTCYLLKFTFW